jgi:hypothetical protein
VLEVASDCSSEAFEGETSVLLMSAVVRAGSWGSLVLVGVESTESLAVARPTMGGATEVAEGGVMLRSLPLGVAVVGLEWAGAKIA